MLKIWNLLRWFANPSAKKGSSSVVPKSAWNIEQRVCVCSPCSWVWGENTKWTALLQTKYCEVIMRLTLSGACYFRFWLEFSSESHSMVHNITCNILNKNNIGTLWFSFNYTMPEPLPLRMPLLCAVKWFWFAWASVVCSTVSFPELYESAA